MIVYFLKSGLICPLRWKIIFYFWTKRKNNCPTPICSASSVNSMKYSNWTYLPTTNNYLINNKDSWLFWSLVNCNLYALYLNLKTFCFLWCEVISAWPPSRSIGASALKNTVIKAVLRTRWSRNYFVVPEPEQEPLLAISAPAPQLRGRNYLFNKYFTKILSVWRINK